MAPFFFPGAFTVIGILIVMTRLNQSGAKVNHLLTPQIQLSGGQVVPRPGYLYVSGIH